MLGAAVPGDSTAALGASDVLGACAPDVDMCAELEGLVMKAGMDSEQAAIVGQGICPGSPCMACDHALDQCEAQGGDCDVLVKFCATSLEHCSCAMDCKPTAELALPELFALCFSYPMATGDECSEPSVGQCFTTISWSGCAGLTSCEYAECHEDLAALDMCPTVMPSSCDKVVACDLAEELDVPLVPSAPQGDFPIVSCASTDTISDVESFCEDNPFGRSAECEPGTGPTAAGCEILLMASHGCDVTLCEYKACAAALAEAPCGESPVECLGISSCVY